MCGFDAQVGRRAQRRRDQKLRAYVRALVVLAVVVINGVYRHGNLDREAEPVHPASFHG